MDKKLGCIQANFEEIEELYFSNRYKEVIALWEGNNSVLLVDYATQENTNILEAIATSYYEIEMYNKSLAYFTTLIKRLKTSSLSSFLKKKKGRNYYLYKVGIYNKLKRRVPEYRAIGEYLHNYGNDESFRKLSDSLEAYFYRKYILINKYLAYIILILIVASIMAPFFGIHLPGSIYRPYSIVTIFFVIWIMANLLFPRFFKEAFLSGIRYCFHPH